MWPKQPFGDLGTNKVYRETSTEMLVHPNFPLRPDEIDLLFHGYFPLQV